jgi:hypothetical protein
VQKEARGKLEKTKYTGEKRNFNFEKYVAIHKKSHAMPLPDSPSTDTRTSTNTRRSESLVANVNTHLVSSTSTFKTSNRKNKITPEQLVKAWNIGLEKAKRTLKSTTQRGIKTVANPSISHRFQTNDRQLRYRRLANDMFSDTMFAGTTSKRGNKRAQVFGNREGYGCRLFPIKRKGEAHEALSLVFARDGVPNTMIVDGALEQVQGDFKRKCREADCRLKQTEPYMPWSNAAEGVIRL